MCNQSNQADELALNLLSSFKALLKRRPQNEPGLIEVSSTKTRQHFQGHSKSSSRSGEDDMTWRVGAMGSALLRPFIATELCD